MAETEEREAIPPEVHRRLAVDLFNEVWRLLDARSRSVEDDERMLHAAHASRHHWGEVGERVNLARGEWQCSRVYSTLGRPEPAIHHARRSLELCEQGGVEDFDLAFAYEALARAHAVAGEVEEAGRFLRMARDAGDAIAEEDDRAVFFDELSTVPL